MVTAESGPSSVNPRDNTPADQCCLEQAVLDSLPVPTAIYDADELLYVNTVAARTLGPERSRPGTPMEEIVPPEYRAELGRALGEPFSADDAAGRCSVRIHTLTGEHLVVGEHCPIRFGPDQRPAMVCFASRIDGAVLLEFSERDDTGENRNSGSVPASDESADCMHSAAFEHFPAPMAFLDKQTIYGVNRRLRQILRATGSMRNTAAGSFLHPAFADQGVDRRHLVIDLGATLSESSVKLRAFDGTDLYGVLDVWPAKHTGDTYMVGIFRHVTRM